MSEDTHVAISLLAVVLIGVVVQGTLIIMLAELL